MSATQSAPFQTPHRRCENCGGAMPGRMHRQRDEAGRLVCDNCKTNTPRWTSAHAATLLLHDPEDRAEFYRREAESVSSILRVSRVRRTIEDLAQGITTIGHDMGDGGVVNHCPFCGSGAVVGGSDGSVECGFCHTVFSVQVQPNNPSMPQTVNGQPFVPPGMPAGEPTEMSEPKDPVAEQQDQQEGEDPSGDQQPKQPGHPSEGDPNPSSKDMIEDRKFNPPHEKAKTEDAIDKAKGDDDGNPFAKKDGDDKAPGKGPDGKPDPFAPVDKSKDDDKGKSLPPWLKKKKSSTGGWETFRFYHGTLTGWRKTIDGRKYEVVPTNGRRGSWDVMEDDYWVGETFPSPDEAKAWIDGPTTAVLGSFQTPDGTLSGEDYMRRLALQFADDRQVVLAEVRGEQNGGTDR